MVKNVTFAFGNIYRNLRLSYLQSFIAIKERAWRAMARLFLSNTNLRNQLIFAGLAIIALAGFLIVKHARQADTAFDTSSHSLNFSNAETPSPDRIPLTELGDASTDSQPSSSSSTSLEVNGQNITLPRNGTISQTMTDEIGTTTTINARHSESSSSSSSESQASSSSSSSVEVNVNSSSVESL